MKIESIRLKNFRLFREMTLDKLPNCCILIGANGTGKSSLFDLFGFLRDALIYDVKPALAKRGGFKEVVSRGTSGPIEIELKFRHLKAISSTVTYLLIIDLIENNPVITREILKYRRGRGGSRHFLDFRLGQGKILTDDFEKKSPATDTYKKEKLTSPDVLALKIMGQLQRFEIASELRHFIKNWHFSDLQISETKKSYQVNGSNNEHLSSQGDNLALFAHWMYHNYPLKYQEILEKMVRRVPGFASVEPIIQDGRIFLQFQDKGFQEPFLAWQISTGTIQLFAHLLLLHDPNPHPLLCVEEPDTQLYPDILMILAEEFSLYAKKGGQVFVSTHSPDFLNGAHLDSIFWLTKKESYTQIHTTAEEELFKRLVDVGDLPGALWTEGFFEGVHP
jgi:predicted ATPase